MSLRGRVLRRKYPEWTLYPKSIQEQRVQLAGLLEAFRYFPFAAASGSMLTVRNQLSTEGFFVGTFPYPTIYPSKLETNLPLATTQWARFMPFWQYTGSGTFVGDIGAGAYTIGFIVVDVTTNPKAPTVKDWGLLAVPDTGARRLELLYPEVNGAAIMWASSSASTASSRFGSQHATFGPKDEFYVCMAFCYQDIPFDPQSNSACLSYYVPPETVLKPQV